MNDLPAASGGAEKAVSQIRRLDPTTWGESLATRISLLLLVVVIVAAGGLAWFNQQVIQTKFAETELRLVLQNRTILERAIATEVDHLKTVVTDWAQWDDLYAFVQGKNPEFGTTELGNVVLDRVELDLILMIDASGNVHYGDARSALANGASGSGTVAATDLAGLLTGRTRWPGLTHTSQLPDSLLAGGGETFAGLLDTPEGPIVVALRPISRTDGSGDNVGSLVMGRFLDAASFLGEISVLPSTVTAHGGGTDEVADDIHHIAREIVRSGIAGRLVTRQDDMSDFMLLRDLAGNPLLILETRMPRSIVATGREATRKILLGLVVASVFALLMLIGVVRRTVSTPLRQLTSHMLILRESSARRTTPGQDRGDEIGVLARRFEELEVARHADGTRLKLLAAAVEHAGDAIAILDAERRITYVNPQYERQTGMNRADVLGQFPSQGHSALTTNGDLWETVLAGQNWSGMLKTNGRDGPIRHEEVTVSPIRDLSSQITSYIAVMHDVTERRQLQEQLNQAQKLEAVGMLAAGVAHEINTPTQYVSGNIRFLDEAFNTVVGLLRQISRLTRDADSGAVPVAALDKALADAEVEFLKAEVPAAIRQSLEGVDRVAEIVRSMRNLSHPARDISLNDLNKVIESAVRLASAEFDDVADIVLDLDPALPRVPCQAGGINQVVVNMLVNAAHAMDSGAARMAGRPGHIAVSTRTSGDHVEIRISDDGCGMSADVRARVFDPFFTTKELGHGTGQGLAIAHNVVKAHNGSIGVDSEPGKGSCFIIRLPMVAVPTTATTGGAKAA